MTKEYCRSCREQIMFGVSDRTGKRIPLNPRPVEGGNVWIVGWQGPTPVVEMASREHRPPPDAELYISHFATCPNAKAHRRRK